MVRITDPDAPLGFVRDFRYRVAVAGAWSAACAWARELEGLGEDDRVRLEAAGYSGRGFVEMQSCLLQTVRTTVRVRFVHAMVRRHVGAMPDWRMEQWGLPVNQTTLRVPLMVTKEPCFPFSTRKSSI